jgi:hypothetical protein
MKPGCIERFDSEYERGELCWVLISFEPLSGWREVVVSERRRKREFALAMRHLAEELHPRAEKKIRVVFLDNLSPHTQRRLSRRASWRRLLVWSGSKDRVLLHTSRRLMAEHGRGGDLCIGEAVPQAKIAGHRETLDQEARAWCTEHNGLGVSVDLRFRTRRMREPSSAASTHQSKSQSKSDRVLARGP